jgi:hypothetical protein
MQISRGVPYLISSKYVREFVAYIENIMALCKLGFIMMQCGWTSELSSNILWKSSILSFSSICEMVYGRYGKSIYDVM